MGSQLQLALTAEQRNALGVQTGQKYRVSMGKRSLPMTMTDHETTPETKTSLLRIERPLAEAFGVPPGRMLNLVKSDDGIRIGPLVGVFTRLARKEGKVFGGHERYYRALMENARKRNSFGFVFAVRDIDWEHARIRGYYLAKEKDSWQRAWFPFPDIYYNRYFGGKKGPSSGEIMNRFARHQVPAFNTVIGDKWLVYRQLGKLSDVADHLPDTGLLTSYDSLAHMVKKHKTVYVKPAGGSRGTGIYRVRHNHLQYFVSQSGSAKTSIYPSISDAYWRVSSGTTRMIVQQGIPYPEGDRLFDVRALVQRDGAGHWRLSGVAARVGAAGGITANLHTGGYATELPAVLRQKGFGAETAARIVEDIRRLALRVAGTLGSRSKLLGELGLDFIVDNKGKVWFIEANPKPGRQSFYRLKDQEVRKLVALRPIDFAVFAAGF